MKTINEVMKLKIDNLELSVRSSNCLKKANIKTLEELTKAAKAGNPRAMAEEGNFILYGWIEGTLENAFEYFRKAAELGERKAYSDLGDCYLYGWGCDQDFQKAMECYKKASWLKHRKIIKQLSRNDFCLKTDGKTVLEEIREFYN